MEHEDEEEEEDDADEDDEACGVRGNVAEAATVFKAVSLLFEAVAVFSFLVRSSFLLKGLLENNCVSSMFNNLQNSFIFVHISLMLSIFMSDFFSFISIVFKRTKSLLLPTGTLLNISRRVRPASTNDCIIDL